MSSNRLFIATIAICISILGSTAILATTAAKEAGRTAIIADERAGVVRILIDGRERAVIDASGLRVSGDIEYTGTITDRGSGHEK